MGMGVVGCVAGHKPTVHPNKKRSIKLSEIALNNYRNFISSKRIVSRNKGIDVPLAAVNPIFVSVPARHCALGMCQKVGRRFSPTQGLGKTFIQLEWARLMGRNTLIVAPLSVARQTVREASKIGIDVRYVRNQGQVTPEHNIWITNYEMLSHFDASILAPSCWMNRQSSNLSTAQPPDACRDVRRYTVQTRLYRYTRLTTAQKSAIIASFWHCPHG